MNKTGFVPQILVIDDERDIREGCERILSRMDCNVHVADNGQAGLDIIEKEDICMVICDIKMPGIDGLEVLKQIKEKNPYIVVIMITGFSTVETAIEAMKKGAYDFISKPFSPDQLRIVARRAVDKLSLEQQARELQQQQEQSLADLVAEKSRMRTIVESLPNGVLVTNIYGQIVLINKMAKSFLDLPDDMVIGETIADCIQDDGLYEYMMKFTKCSISDDEAVESYEMALDEERYILAQGRPVVGEDGQCLGAVVNLSDISDMKLFDRLKSEFVAKVSHELRSPLSVIHGQLGMVLRKNEKQNQDGSNHILGRAKEKTQTLISMIGDLLDISKIESGKDEQTLANVQVDELVEKIVEFLIPQAEEKKQTLSLKLPSTPFPAVLADPVALESVYGNLIVNAIKYTPEKGNIQVRVCVKDKQVIVTVKDTGFGIEKKHLSKIFEKFYRIKDDQTRLINGTGLGLPIAKAIVDTMQGEILVKSQPGKGSEFTVQLPVAQ